MKIKYDYFYYAPTSAPTHKTTERKKVSEDSFANAGDEQTREKGSADDKKYLVLQQLWGERAFIIIFHFSFTRATSNLAPRCFTFTLGIIYTLNFTNPLQTNFPSHSHFRATHHERMSFAYYQNEITLHSVLSGWLSTCVVDYNDVGLAVE